MNIKEHNKIQREIAIKDYYKNPKKCLFCNKIILVKRKVSDIKRRKFCNQSCAAKFNKNATKKKIKKKCLYCKKEIFGDKKFCDNKCQNNYQYIKFIKSWLKGKEKGGKGEGSPSTYIRRYLFKKHNSKCSKCRWGKTNPISKKIPLTINHINGNSEDHRPDNLELLCPNCHSLTPTFGNLNKGKGRKRRLLKLRAVTANGGGSPLQGDF